MQRDFDFITPRTGASNISLSASVDPELPSFKFVSRPSRFNTSESLDLKKKSKCMVEGLNKIEVMMRVVIQCL